MSSIDANSQGAGPASPPGAGWHDACNNPNVGLF